MNNKFYVIEKESSTEALEMIVGERINQGYVPTGGVAFDSNKFTYMQALYLPVENRPQPPLKRT